jgi:hypothetical protein
MLLLCLGTLFEELFDRGQFGLQFGRVAPVMFLIVVSFLVFPTCSGYSLPPSSLKGKNGCHRKIIALANRGNSNEGPPNGILIGVDIYVGSPIENNQTDNENQE